jgi:hypothetical protein
VYSKWDIQMMMNKYLMNILGLTLQYHASLYAVSAVHVWT